MLTEKELRLIFTAMNKSNFKEHKKMFYIYVASNDYTRYFFQHIKNHRDSLSFFDYFFSSNSTSKKTYKMH